MKILDDIHKIKLIDKTAMYSQIYEFPVQCLQAMELGLGLALGRKFKDVNKIIFVGMGGSAIGAQIIKDYLTRESRLPIQVIREYQLPAFVDRKTLVFIISYSGNTEETLSSYFEARKREAKIIIICSGGRLLAQAKRNKIPYVIIPSGLAPRGALGYLSIVPLVILSHIGLVKNISAQIKEMAKNLSDLRDSSLDIKIRQENNLSKQIASKIFGKLTVIYGASMGLEAAVARFRAQLAENSKALSFSHLFPEMNHNEIVGWQNPGRLFEDLIVVFLRDRDEHLRVKRRIDITKQILKRQGVEIIEIKSVGESLLSRLFSLIYICDFVSFYLAILYRVDPTPVDKVTYLKKQLAKLK